jgi:azurin/glucose/arabinose dehydrogenase
MWGGRSKIGYTGGQNNAVVLWHELVMLDAMTANRDRAIWSVARGGGYAPADDGVPAPMEVVSNVGGKSPSSHAHKEGSTAYLSGEEGIAKMRIAKGFEVGLFADEAMFPELANPVQMQVDGKGRIWVAAWHTYPKWEPLKEMRDALLILEDRDGDGRADSCKEFARVHNPVGFEFWNGGVLVTSAPDLLFLKDTDGDDVADVREVILGGFGSADTHHAANNLVMGPDGAIYWQSGIFLKNAHEHPWGPSLITGASGMYRFDPRRFTVAFHAALDHNPHGISFDQWGYHYATDGTSGRAFQVRPEGKGFKMHELLQRQYRPVPANAVVSSQHFPDELQGDFLIANTIGFRGIMGYDLQRDGHDGRNVGEVWGTPGVEMVRSEDGNFRPTDMVFGAEGALYFSDWCNIIIGHSAHHIRDPNRDKQHGRVYRMVHRERPLQQPVAIAGEPLDCLMRNLEHPVDGVRHRTRVELSGRSTDEVIEACREWLRHWDKGNPEHSRHILEALWVHQQHNVRDRGLLDTVLSLPVEHARIAGETVRHHWDVADPALGHQEIEEHEVMEVEPGGVVSDSPELTTLRINTISEQLRYDVTELEISAGKTIKLIFNNPDAVPHNLVIVKPGTADTVAAAAIALGAEGFAREFIPESADILHHTALLNGGESQTLEFTAPSDPGDYQFVCTFPGHAMLMRGIIRVK